MMNFILDDKDKCNCFDKSLRDEMLKYIGDLSSKKHKNLSDYKTFWPPRLMKALENQKLSCFFGAGLSRSSTLPCVSTKLIISPLSLIIKCNLKPKNHPKPLLPLTAKPSKTRFCFSLLIWQATIHLELCRSQLLFVHLM